MSITVCISVTLAGEDQPPTLTAGDAIKCYGKATKMTPSEKVRSPFLLLSLSSCHCVQVIFKHRICSHIGWLETLIESLPIKSECYDKSSPNDYINSVYIFQQLHSQSWTTFQMSYLTILNQPILQELRHLVQSLSKGNDGIGFCILLT